MRANALLFQDPRSLALLRQVELVASTEVTVLVAGETGTGKALLAHHIHQLSGQRGPYVAVQCGAYSEALIDAGLFGQAAGAAAGVSGARAGAFEAAQGGTLFLDEIGELSLPLQAKLLRRLQERPPVRPGERQPIPPEVRLVVDTPVNLQQAVEAGRFRADLFWRLSVATLFLPPLRDRPGDILPLARHFIALYRERLGLATGARHGLGLTPQAEALLLAHPWPGNIRELENVLHFGLIVSPDGRLAPEHLKLASAASAPAVTPSGRLSAASPASAPVAATASASASAPPEQAADSATPAAQSPGKGEDLAPVFDHLLAKGATDLLAVVERTLIRRTWAHSGHNQVRAARLLGISRNSVRTLLKRHGLLDAPNTDTDTGDTDPAPSPAPVAAPAIRPPIPTPVQALADRPPTVERNAAPVRLDTDSPDLASTYAQVVFRQFDHGRELVALLDLKPDAQVLDVGCGTGLLGAWVAEQLGPQGLVIGLDPLPLRVALAGSKHPRLVSRIGRAEDLSDFADGSIDAVFLNSVIHWVADQPRALAEALRVLKPGGQLAINCADAARPHDAVRLQREVLQELGLFDPEEDIGAPHRLDGPGLRRLLTAAGFTGVSVTPRTYTDRMADVDELITWTRSSSFGNWLSALSDEQRVQARAGLAGKLAPLNDGDGLSLRRHLVFGVARKP